MRWRKTPTELKRKRIEDEVYLQRVRAEMREPEGQEVSEPTIDRPCERHPEWEPPRRLPTQPPTLLACPFCLEEQGAARRRTPLDVEPDEVAHPQWADIQLSERGMVAVADWRERERGRPGAPGTQEERFAIELIDQRRAEEMAWLELSPQERFRRRRRAHARAWLARL
jgi:hypothetical protein